MLRKKYSTFVDEEGDCSEGEPSPTSVLSFRKPRTSILSSKNPGSTLTQKQREVTLERAPGEAIGAALAKPSFEYESCGPVVVGSVALASPAAKSKLLPGDFLISVNGVPCGSYQHASQLIRNANGNLKLSVSSPGSLPEGWASFVDTAGLR